MNINKEITALTGAVKRAVERVNDEHRALTKEEEKVISRALLRVEELLLKEPEPGRLTLEDGPLGYRDGAIPMGQYSGRSTAHDGPAMDKTFRGMFYSGNTRRQLDTGKFKDGEFLEILASQRHDPRLVRSMLEGTPSAGGFSVPEVLAAKWLDSALRDEIVRPLATVWPMTSKTRSVPAWDDHDQSSGELFGGLKMEFLAEEGTGTKQTAKLRLITLDAKKGAIYIDASNELVSDGLGFESQLETALKKSISYGFDKYFLTGVGGGMPQGVFASPALITVSKEGAQVAGTIEYANLVKMFARQLNKSRAVWLFNDNAVPQLLEITIPIGTGGSHVPLLKENSGKFTIFGRPVYFTPIMPALGSAMDCGFIDFGSYAIGMRKEVSIDKSNIPGWTTDVMSYRIIVRFDGMGTLDAAITPENGDTMSPFVTIEERT